VWNLDLGLALKLAYGSRGYAAGYDYDPQGRVKQMTNWSGFSATAANNGTGARVTSWNYSPQRGWLTSKLYDGAAGPSYTYTPAGRLQTRTWARGITTTYAYNTLGDLYTAAYNGGTPGTPGISYLYDRRGRLRTADRNGMQATLAYTGSDAPLTESYTGGTLGGLSVERHYDAYLRLQDVMAKQGSTSLQDATYGYDAAGRVQSLTDGSYIANYTYAVQCL